MEYTLCLKKHPTLSFAVTILCLHQYAEIWQTKRINSEIKNAHSNSQVLLV